MKPNTKWMLYVVLSSFSIYWTVNLILWFPWSISTTLGMTLMLTFIPWLWAYGIYNNLKRYQGSLINGAIWLSFIYILIAVIADYWFFGIVRNAMKELYHSTTLYGYGFLILLPFMILWMFQKRLEKRKNISSKNFYMFLVMGVLSVLGVFLIITFNITI